MMIYSLMTIYSFLLKILVRQNFSNELSIIGVDLDKTNLDCNNNFDEDDRDTIIHARIGAIKLKNTQHMKNR